MTPAHHRFGVARDAVVRAARALHPFLFAVTPILYISAKNAHQIELGQAGRPLAYMLAVAGLLTWGLRRLLGDYALAAVLASLALIAFFAGGALHELLREGASPLPWGVAVALEWGLLAAALWLAWRWLRADAERVRLTTTFLAVFALLAAAESAADFLRHDRIEMLFGRGRPAEVVPPRPAAPPLAAETPSHPDIYFIVADAYARRDVLERVYGVDAGRFTQWLESRGFYVATEATSNYAMTYLSLAATLNMEYLDPARMPATVGKAGDRVPYYRMIRAPAVARELQARGYRYVQVLTHWGGTDRSYAADLSYRLVPLDGDEFTVALVNKTLLRAFTPRLADQHRFILDRAAAIADIPGPTFAFVHLLLPHSPYVFDADGKVIADLPLGMDFRRHAEGWKQREPFVDQLAYTDRVLGELIDTILARSKVPPIIVLQGDHGTAHTRDAADPDGLRPNAWERLGVLSAFHVPPALRARLYPSITPVNTFRLLLDAQFGAGLAPLPDRNFFSYYQTAYEFEEKTGQLAVPPASP